jgi:formate dehydrogenase iron-sulfur subunit
MTRALLIDVTRCTGCRGCQVACKQWNELPGEKTSVSTSWTNPKELSAYTWTHVDFREVPNAAGGFSWNFVHKRCFHCLEPACVSACPVGALQKTEEGPVVYDASRCIGCRYCMVACPFEIPKFTWDSAQPVIAKCTFCADRLADGQEPACAKSCPTDAIQFGERDDLIVEAQRRIQATPARYVNYVYGKDEAGGTSVMYLSGVPFDRLGFKMDISHEPYPERTWEALSKIPWEVLGVAAVMSGTWFIIQRRQKNGAKLNASRKAAKR